LNVVQCFIIGLEFQEKLLAVATILNYGVFVSFDHNVTEEFINLHEFRGFERQLFLNVRRVENILQIHPIPLTSQPLIYDIRNQHQPLFPLLDLRSNLLHESRAQHRLNAHLMIIQSGHNILDSFNDEFVLGISIRVHQKRQFRPFLPNRVQLRLNLRLTARAARDIFHQILLFQNSPFHQLLECKYFSRGVVRVQCLEYLLPVSLS